MLHHQHTHWDIISEDQERLRSCLHYGQVSAWRYHTASFMDSMREFVQHRFFTSMAIVSVINTIVLVSLSAGY